MTGASSEARPEARQSPVPVVVFAAFSVAYYAAALLVGFQQPDRFFGTVAAVGLPALALLAMGRASLADRLGEPQASRVLGSVGVLLAIGLESRWYLPFLRLMLPLLALTAAGLFACEGVAARGGEAARRAVVSVVLVGIAVTGFLLLFQTVVIHDAFQYVATLRGLLVGRSTDLFEDVFILNSTGSYNPWPEGSLRYLGVPILQVPAYLAGAVAARIANALGGLHPTNGHSLPYLIAISLSSCVAGLAALFVSVRVAGRRASRRSSLIAGAVFFLASPLVFFTFQWHGWTHTYGALLTALFLDVWLSDPGPGGRFAPRRAATLGGLGGFGALIWPPMGLLFVLPVADALRRDPSDGHAPWSSRTGAVARAAAILGLVAGLAFFPQLAGWKVATGRFLGNTYATVGDYFDWLHPAIGGFLFSGPRHGAITWHPVLALCLAGVLLVRDRGERTALAVLCATEIFVLSCWSIWWTGIGFGNRFLLNLSPVFVLGLAVLLDRAGRGRRSWAVLAALFILVYGNLSLMSAYRLERIMQGIKAPNYVQDEPPSATEVARRLLVRHPLDPRDFLRPLHFNRCLLGERLVLARRSGRLLELLGLAGVLAGLGALALFMMKKLVWAPGPLAPAAAATLVGASTVAAVFILTACHGGPRRVERTHIPVSSRSGPLENQDTIELVPARTGSRPTAVVHVISFLTHAWGIEQGTVVARVTVRGTRGEETAFDLRVGHETAECSVARPEWGPELRHSCANAEPVRMWIDDRGSEHLYPVYTFRARLPLDPAFEVATLEVAYVHPAGRLFVTDVFLR